VSHMTVVDIQGRGAREFMRRLLANDLARLGEKGQALYACMLNEDGGVIDDLLTYWLDDELFRSVLNAARREDDLAWMHRVAADFDVEIVERDDLAIIAV